MARVIVSPKIKEKTVPVNYKIQPLTKAINQIVTECIKKMAPESGMNYSEHIDDMTLAVLESDLVIYQIDDIKYTLKDILKKYLENQEDAIKEYIEDSMPSGEGTELFYERIKDDIQVKFGSVFDVAEKIDITWARRLERYIEIVHEKQNLAMDHDLMTVIGVLFKNKILYMFNEDDVNLIYKDSKFKKNVSENYINLRLLTDSILKDYGHLVFIDTDEITIKKIVIDEALKDFNLKSIAKKNRYIV